jgi:hypothetical protein
MLQMAFSLPFSLENHIYIYIYICMYVERERERERGEEEEEREEGFFKLTFKRGKHVI